jgi:hypothetical protein
MTLATHVRLYRGLERRRNRVFVTVNSEYHCRDRVCVAVRNRATGELEPDHRAVGLWLSGGVRFDPDACSATAPPEIPHEGEQLCFTSLGRDPAHDLVTSTVERIERPTREVAAHYPPERRATN